MNEWSKKNNNKNKKSLSSRLKKVLRSHLNLRIALKCWLSLPNKYLCIKRTLSNKSQVIQNAITCFFILSISLGCIVSKNSLFLMLLHCSHGYSTFVVTEVSFYIQNWLDFVTIHERSSMWLGVARAFKDDEWEEILLIGWILRGFQRLLVVIIS